MKKWLCVVAVIAITGCQKGITWSDVDGTGNNTGGNGNTDSSAIAGTWRFISFSGAYQSNAQTTLNDSDFSYITSINFATTNGAGTFVFNNDSTFAANYISYNLSYIVHNYNYENGVLTDSNNIHESYPADSANSTGTYQLINSDSIYFPSGYALTLNTLTTPGGANYKITGDILTITQKSVTDSTTETGGVPYHTTTNSTDTLILQKQ